MTANDQVRFGGRPLEKNPHHGHLASGPPNPKKLPGTYRTLGLPTWSDKLLAEVVRMLLDAYYDVQFSDHSHGFRPGRGCRTALREVVDTWTGSQWFLEGDITRCFRFA